MSYVFVEIEFDSKISCEEHEKEIKNKLLAITFEFLILKFTKNVNQILKGNDMLSNNQVEKQASDIYKKKKKIGKYVPKADVSDQDAMKKSVIKIPVIKKPVKKEPKIKKFVIKRGAIEKPKTDKAAINKSVIKKLAITKTTNKKIGTIIALTNEKSYNFRSRFANDNSIFKKNI